jgi:hypothetical protein
VSRITANLLALSDGKLSLEFQESSLEALKKILVREGASLARHEALGDTITVQGATLFYCNEFDPCLIASSAQACVILERIFKSMKSLG